MDRSTALHSTHINTNERKSCRIHQGKAGLRSTLKRTSSLARTALCGVGTRLQKYARDQPHMQARLCSALPSFLENNHTSRSAAPESPLIPHDRQAGVWGATKMCADWLDRWLSDSYIEIPDAKRLTCGVRAYVVGDKVVCLSTARFRVCF